MFVAMGNYTDANATQFAAAVGMPLVDGEELLRIIGTGPDGETLELPVPSPVSAPPRPACGSAMVRRTARQGPRAGLDFWGLHVSCLPQNGRDPRRGVGRALTGRRFLPNEPRPLVS